MIKVSGLCFRYPKNHEDTLHDITFGVGRGEIFGFIGPSGAGKSTTVKVLIGLLKDYKGEVTVLRQPAGDAGKEFYEHLGAAFEVPNLFEKFTAMENLVFFRGLYKRTGMEPLTLLSMVGLRQHADVRVEKYSKGMKVRLNFIRALINNPELIFLDEPTSGLDPANTKTIIEIILDLKRRGKTIFLSTHNINVAETLCDKLAFLVDGRINLIDSPRNLKLRYGKKILIVEYKKNGAPERESFELDGLAENKAYLDILAARTIETMHTQEARLDDVFIQVTGRRLV
jgi:fluoroquinolone transport system ATP-binding protein